MNFLKLLFITQFFFFTTYCNAADHYLLDSHGLLKKSYVSDKPFEVGDRLIFSGDDIFIFKEELGRGNTTSILRVSRANSTEEFALRVPQTSTKIKDTNRSISYLNEYISGYQELLVQGVPTPNVLEYSENHYALISIVDFDFVYSDLFNPMSEMPQDIKIEAESALLEFARKTAMFKIIGDFHSEQLVYNAETKEWTLLDWVDSHYKINLISDDFFLSGRLAISEVRQARHAYDAKYGHPMPRKMIEHYLQKVNEFFIELQNVVEKERALFLASDQELLTEFIKNLSHPENIVESFKNIPTFRTGLPIESIRSSFDTVFISSNSIISASFDDLKVIYSNLEYENHKSFIKHFDLILSKVKDIDQLAWVIKYFSKFTLTEKDKLYVNNAVELLWDNLDFGDEKTLAQRTKFLHKSPFLSNGLRRKFRKMIKMTPFQNCVQSLRLFF